MEIVNLNVILITLTMISTIVLYFSPSLLAYSTNHSETKSIFIFNALLGWTVICWIASFLWLLNE